MQTFLTQYRNILFFLVMLLMVSIIFNGKMNKGFLLLLLASILVLNGDKIKSAFEGVI